MMLSYAMLSAAEAANECSNFGARNEAPRTGRYLRLQPAGARQHFGADTLLKTGKQFADGHIEADRTGESGFDIGAPAPGFDIGNGSLRLQTGKQRQLPLGDMSGLAVFAQTAVMCRHGVLPAHLLRNGAYSA